MSGAPSSAVEAALESQRIGALQIRVALLCALVQVFDGYDISAIGMTTPVLIHVWGLPPAAFGQAFVMSSVGILVGALLSGPLGDRLGRKPLLIVSTAWIGVFSLASAFAPSLPVMVVLRFLTGIGLGGAMPATVALTSDYAPARSRGTFIMLMFCGNTVGGFLGGQIAARVLPHLGWESIFLFGGVAPLALVPLLALLLPESPRFLLARRASSPSAQRLFARLGIAEAAASATAGGGIDIARGNPVAALFGEGMARRTLLLWLIFFMGLLDLYLLSYWLPAVLHLSGLSPADAAFAASMQTAGGVVSLLALGPLSQRFGAARVLAVSFGLGALFIAAIGLLALPASVLLLAIFGAGAGTIGSQLAANALCATLYPARMRSTGIGWALGIGRLGAIVGPGLGGALLALGWPPRQIFLCACLGALIACAATLVLGRRRRRHAAAPAM
jgi:AAHS family 4-hydroxybenzoate transporter-like MFS transporter